MQKRVPILLGLILLCIAVWLYITPIKVIRLLFERFENVGYDLQVRARVLTEKRLTQSAVAIIDLDDHSLTVEGQWPWPRSKLANLVLELKKQGVAVVAFDMLFAESQRNSAQIVAEELAKQGMLTPATAAELDKGKAFFDDDGIFSTALSQIDSVLALGFLNKKSENNLLPPPLLTLSDPQSQSLLINHAEGYIGNLPSLQKAAKGAGFINIYPDNDGIIRRAPLIIEYQHQIYPSLALQAAMLFLSEKVHLKTANYSDQLKLEGIQLGNITIPTDEQGQLLIPFFGHSYTFPYYSATDVLHGRIPANALLGKIVFLGTSATGLGDLKATAVQNPFPGVEIQASIVNGILQQHFSYQPAWTYGANLLFIIVTGVLCSFLFPYLGPKSLAAIIVLVPPTIMSFNYWLRNEYGLILSFLIPNLLIFTSVLLNIIYGYLFENRRREKLKAMFGQYVPAKHIDEMLQKHSDYALRGEDREMSVLFADIRNFTSISEGMSATNLVDMLNTFFTPMTEIIFNHHGTIDKYVGDLIMAFWGAPLKDEQHASHALESALEMRAKIQSLQPMLAEKKMACHPSRDRHQQWRDECGRYGF